MLGKWTIVRSLCTRLCFSVAVRIFLLRLKPLNPYLTSLWSFYQDLLSTATSSAPRKPRLHTRVLCGLYCLSSLIQAADWLSQNTCRLSASSDYNHVTATHPRKSLCFFWNWICDFKTHVTDFNDTYDISRTGVPLFNSYQGTQAASTLCCQGSCFTSPLLCADLQRRRSF